jgi:hypothetical protein
MTRISGLQVYPPENFIALQHDRNDANNLPELWKQQRVRETGKICYDTGQRPPGVDIGLSPHDSLTA